MSNIPMLLDIGKVVNAGENISYMLIGLINDNCLIDSNYTVNTYLHMV